MLPTIFTQSYYSGKSFPLNQRDALSGQCDEGCGLAYQPYYANEVLAVLGRVRLRQLRVKPDSCEVSPYLQGRVSECYAPYTASTEDRGSCGDGESKGAEGWDLVERFPGLEWRDYSDGGARESPSSKVFYGSGGWIYDLPLGADASVGALTSMVTFFRVALPTSQTLK